MPPDQRVEPTPVVYIPCGEHVATPAQARPLLKRTDDGRLLMLVYSTVDKLEAGWGAGHPWLAWPTESLDALRESQRVEFVALDRDVSEGS
jgi:hypothetical protein